MAGGASNDIRDLSKLEGTKNPSIFYLKSYGYRIFLTEESLCECLYETLLYWIVMCLIFS